MEGIRVGQFPAVHPPQPQRSTFSINTVHTVLNQQNDTVVLRQVTSVPPLLTRIGPRRLACVCLFFVN